MFIREVTTKNKKTGKEYKKLVLVESIRTEKGPRQRTVMQLGSIELPKSKWKALAACLERKLSGQTTFTEEAADVEKTASIEMQNYSVFKRKKNEKNRRKENSNFVKVDLNTVIYEGAAASQTINSGAGQLLGGGNQVYIQEVNANWFK